MKLAIYSGSPRGKSGNTEIIMKHFINGYKSVDNDEIMYYHLNNAKDREEAVKNFGSCEMNIIVFPLYVFSMPGQVMELFENLPKLKNSVKIGFIVHSGFPEASHSRALEKYLQSFPTKVNAEYIGTAIKGGSEGLRLMPERMNKKLFSNFYTLGVKTAQEGILDKEIINKLAKPENFSPITLFFIKFLSLFVDMNKYWNMLLNQNNAYDKRFDKPYKA